MKCNNCNREIEYAAVCPYCGARTLKEPLQHHLPSGTVIDGRYRIEGVLGEGGFGITYLGHNMRLGMDVAVKEYYPQGAAYRTTAGNAIYFSNQNTADAFAHGKERFLREARTLVRFNAEPGIVSVIDFVEENNTGYLIMEYLDGVTLQQYLKRRGRLSADEAFTMLEPMMRTLAKIHEAGVIHRDISPDNIMRLKNGQMKLMDFGAAREFMDENRSMSIMLKKGYAPEEQYRRKGEQGPWTDVYALCATIYRCITGKAPIEVLDRMVGEELPKPSALGADISLSLESLLLYGMAVNKKDRCQSMTELLELLEQARKVKPAAGRTKEDATVFANETVFTNETIFANEAARQNKAPEKKSETFAPTYPNAQRSAPYASMYPGRAARPANQPSPVNRQVQSNAPQAVGKAVQVQMQPGVRNTNDALETAKKGKSVAAVCFSIIVVAALAIVLVVTVFGGSKSSSTRTVKATEKQTERMTENNKTSTWEASNVVWNTEKNDDTTDIKSFSKYSGIYIHFTLENSGSEISTKPIIEYTNPDGTTETYRFTSECYSGHRNWYRWSYITPKNGAAGTLTVRICDEDGAVLYTGDVEITD